MLLWYREIPFICNGFLAFFMNIPEVLAHASQIKQLP
jgi:hypothetical protein